MYAIELTNITKAYRRTQVLKDVTLKINEGSFTVIFGGPATGKSVLQRLIVGLEKPDSGTILIRGQDAIRIIPSERNIGYVPQSFALYPHYSVYDNIAYPLQLAGVPRAEIKPVVEEAASLLKITHLLDKKPNQLSGGEKQRVAIARGIVKKTEIFIFDDPLTGLDYKLREQLFDDFRRLRETLSATFVYTTSDPLETLMMASEVAVLTDGRIVEQGEVEQVYYNPCHAKTMLNLGFPEATLLAGRLEPEDGGLRCRTRLFDFRVDVPDGAKGRSDVIMGVRPQDLHVNEKLADHWLTVDARITLSEDLGGELVLYLEKGDLAFETVLPHRKAHLLTGDDVSISVNPEALVIFDPSTGFRMGQGAA